MMLHGFSFSCVLFAVLLRFCASWRYTGAQPTNGLNCVSDLGAPGGTIPFLIGPDFWYFCYDDAVTPSTGFTQCTGTGGSPGARTTYLVSTSIVCSGATPVCCNDVTSCGGPGTCCRASCGYLGAPNASTCLRNGHSLILCQQIAKQSASDGVDTWTLDDTCLPKDDSRPVSGVYKTSTYNSLSSCTSDVDLVGSTPTSLSDCEVVGSSSAKGVSCGGGTLKSESYVTTDCTGTATALPDVTTDQCICTTVGSTTTCVKITCASTSPTCGNNNSSVPYFPSSGGSGMLFASALVLLILALL